MPNDDVLMKSHLAMVDARRLADDLYALEVALTLKGFEGRYDKEVEEIRTVRTEVQGMIGLIGVTNNRIQHEEED